MYRNFGKVEKNIFQALFFLSVCQDSDTQENTKKRDRREFILMPKCVYFQTKEKILGFVAFELQVPKYRNIGSYQITN